MAITLKRLGHWWKPIDLMGPASSWAYLPGGENDRTKALDVLKETKRAIDAGFWPLYRWNPARTAQVSWGSYEHGGSFPIG